MTLLVLWNQEYIVEVKAALLLRAGTVLELRVASLAKVGMDM
jgi:hypothetical protein